VSESGNALISVIIGVYNGEAYLGEAIDSVLSQTYSPVELIVVDDGSEDGTAQVIKRYGSAVRHVHQPNAGMGAARNAGVVLAEGRFLAFLDADDRFTREKLESQMEVFASEPAADVVFGHMTEFISPDVDDEARALLRQPVHDVAWRTPNLMLVTREAFDRVGLFSTTLKVGIGVDWYARSLEKGLKASTPPVVVLERRLHADNNGIRQRGLRPQYLHVLKAAIDRRRQVLDTSSESISS
jgi:glycosyltransferase involved in cell wall biosynthesis